MGGGSSMNGVSAIRMTMMVAAAAAILAGNMKTSSSSELDPEYCNDVVEYVTYCITFFTGSEPKPDVECCYWFRAHSHVYADFLVDVCKCLHQSGYAYHPNLNANIPQQCNFTFPVTLPPINDHNCTMLGSSR